jgi:hypothetical protein
MFAAFGYPTSNLHGWQLVVMATLVVGYRCRESSGKITALGKVLLMLLLLVCLWVAQV